MRRCSAPVVHDLFQFCVGEVEIIAAHCFHGTDRAAVAASQFRDFALLPQVTVDAMLHDRNAEHLRCRRAVDILPIGKSIHTPLLPGKPCDNSRLDCAEISYDKLISLAGNKRRAYQLRQCIRNIIIEKLHCIIVAAFEQFPCLRQIFNMVLGQVLKLYIPPCETTAAACTVKLKCASRPVIRTSDSLHCRILLNRAFRKLLPER